MKKKNLVLHGSYYMDNFGDTLFVVYFYKWLKEAGYLEEYNLVLPYAHERVRELVNVEDSTGIKSIKNADKAVFIGGGYLGERPQRQLSWHVRLFVRHLKIGLILNALKIPFVFIGVGAGPLSNFLTRKITVFLANKSEKILVRDQESKDYLLNYGVKENNIESTADSILLLNEEDVDSNWNNYYNHKFSNKEITHYIGVHLPVGFSKKEKLEILIKDIKIYTEGVNNFKIIVFNDFYREGYNYLASDILNKYFTDDEVINIKYEEPNQLIALINNLDIVLTTKLHCGIVSNCLGKYTIGISVHPKTTRLYSQLNLDDRQKLIDEYVEGNLNQLLNGYEKGKIYNNIPNEVRRLAQKNKDALINFIK